MGEIRHASNDTHRTPPVDLTAFALASLVVAAGAALQGTIGFGLGVFAVPLLLLFVPALVPGPLLASSILLTVLLAHHDRAGIHWRDLAWALSGRSVGIVLAAGLIVTVSPRAMALWSGALVLFAVALSASGLHVQPAPRSLLAAGLLSGVLGTAVSIGGPPIALLYQHETGARLRGTLAAFFLIGVTLSLLGLRMARRFGLPELRLALYLVPGVLAGFLVSRRAGHLLDRGFTRPAILIVSALSSVLVILRALD
jgi:uncharacterized membrane protein YfcA